MTWSSSTSTATSSRPAPPGTPRGRRPTTHQPAGTLLGVIGAELLPVLHVPSVLTNGGDVGTWPCPLLVTSPDLGRELAGALGRKNLCHLQGHGVVSVADDLRRAVLAAIAVEQLAEANLTILQTGRRPRVIQPDELSRLSETVAAIGGRWAYYLELAGLDPAEAVPA